MRLPRFLIRTLQPFTPPNGSPLTPILLSDGGRSGTTLLMQLLGTSTEIAFPQTYPFEHRYLTYLLRWAYLVDPTRHKVPDQSVRRNWVRRITNGPDDGLIPPLPWASGEIIVQNDEELPFWWQCFSSAWMELSKRATQRSADGVVSYWAEKVPHCVHRELKGRIPLKIVYPLRDTRDVWLSWRAFDEKRGVPELETHDEETLAEFAARFAEGDKQRLGFLSQLQEDDEEIIVRYERLVTDLQRESQRLARWLGVELDADRVTRQASQFQHHMTAKVPAESVARWKREMPLDINEVFLRCVGSELQALGYDV